MAEYFNATDGPLPLESGVTLPPLGTVELASLAGTDAIHVATLRLRPIGELTAPAAVPMTLVKTDGTDLFSSADPNTPLAISSGPAGADGAVWHYVSALPGAGVGVVGDFALRDTGAVYEKTGASAWTLRGNLTGPAGTAGTNGTNGANGAAGANGVNFDDMQRGTWVSGATYAPSEMVRYSPGGGKFTLYMCIQAVVASATPPPDDVTHWDAVATAGTDGAAGAGGKTLQLALSGYGDSDTTGLTPYLSPASGTILRVSSVSSLPEVGADILLVPRVNGVDAAAGAARPNINAGTRSDVTDITGLALTAGTSVLELYSPSSNPIGHRASSYPAAQVGPGNVTWDVTSSSAAAGDLCLLVMRAQALQTFGGTPGSTGVTLKEQADSGTVTKALFARTLPSGYSNPTVTLSPNTTVQPLRVIMRGAEALVDTASALSVSVTAGATYTIPSVVAPDDDRHYYDVVVAVGEATGAVRATPAGFTSLYTSSRFAVFGRAAGQSPGTIAATSAATDTAETVVCFRALFASRSAVSVLLTVLP